MSKTLWLTTRDETLSVLLRAALASQRLTPLEWPPESVLTGRTPSGRSEPPSGALLLLDLAWAARDSRGTTEILRRAQALPWQPQVLAIAPVARPMWSNEQAWARDLLGHELVLRPLAGQPETTAEALASINFAAGLGEVDRARLETHLRVLIGTPAEAYGDARLIARVAGSPSELATEMMSGVEIIDRSYHLKKYPQCFVGRAAVDWLAKRYSLGRDLAVQLGEGLHQAGLLHHVVKDQPFRDGEFFYRLATPGHFDTVAIEAALSFLRDAPGLVADRSWRGGKFPRCMVGSEAIDALAQKFRLSRAEATVLGQSLLDLGLLRHVADEHPFADDFLFYRIADAHSAPSPAARAPERPRAQEARLRP